MKTDERIVQAMAELLRLQGYAGTGIKQLAQASGAPVGSIYHHFPGGKAEIAARVLRTTGAAYIQLVPLLLDPYDDLVAGVAAAFDARPRTSRTPAGPTCARSARSPARSPTASRPCARSRPR